MKLKFCVLSLLFSFSLLFSGENVCIETDNLQNTPPSIKQKIECDSIKKFEALKDYLNKYFLRVFLIRDKFLWGMTPEKIAESLKEVIDILSDKPWLCLEQIYKKIFKSLTPEERKEWKAHGYDVNFLEKIFKDKNVIKWLKTGGTYWEFMADQLCYYCDFIEKARVDLKNNFVFKAKMGGYVYTDPDTGTCEVLSLDRDENKSEEKLKTYWEKKGITVHHQLYALTFDYYAKLFLEGIKNKDSNQADRYLIDLKIIMTKLYGSEYEEEYLEDIKTYKELFDLLKQKTKIEIKGAPKNKYFDELMEFYDTD